MGHNRFRVLVEELEQAGFDWQAELARNLSVQDIEELVRILKEWIRYDAPLDLQRMGFDVLLNATGKSRSGVIRLLSKRIGNSKTFRYLMRDFKGRRKSR